MEPDVYKRQGQISDRVCEMHVAFRHAQKMTGLIRSYRNLQGMAVRHSDVLAGKTDQAAGNICLLYTSRCV